MQEIRVRGQKIQRTKRGGAGEVDGPKTNEAAVIMSLSIR